jgi:proline dehydrogenase
MNLDFNNTSIAYGNKSDSELKKASWLFGMMNQSWLVNIGVGFALCRNGG